MKIKWETLSKLSTSLAVLWSLSGCDHLLSSQMPRGSVPMVKTYTEAIEGERNKRNYHHQVVNFALKKEFKKFLVSYFLKAIDAVSLHRHHSLE